MIYRSYGNTGKKIPVISAGGMRYSNPRDIESMAQIPLEAAQNTQNYLYIKSYSAQIFDKEK